MSEPVARSEGLLVEPMGDDLLVFEPATGRAHSLNAAAASVWRACDGTRDVDALAACCGLDPIAVALGLDSLRGCELLIDFEGPRVSRRQALRMIAVLGAGIAAVPVIRSIIAPSAAMAASTACVAHGDFCQGQSCCPKSDRGVFCTAKLAVPRHLEPLQREMQLRPTELQVGARLRPQQLQQQPNLCAGLIRRVAASVTPPTASVSGRV
jgi:Coenzyme PQQ synthesis protein D (PqqD)